MKEPALLEEQLESELVVLRRGEAAIQQVIEADDETAGMGTEGSADDGSGEPADDRAKDKWTNVRAGRLWHSGSVPSRRQISFLVDVCQHLLILPKPR